jgi:radical SAM superfamily enzyme YgiQ (UPF0313 family)
MKVLLIPNPTALDGVTEKHIPLGLLYVATALRDKEYQAEILDINLLPRGTGVEGLTEEILSRDPDVIGFSAMCDQYPRVLSLSRRLKKQKPDVVTMLGGPEPTLTAAATVARFPQIDIVVAGECEQTIADVVGAIQNHRSLKGIPGLTFRDGGASGPIISTPPAPLVEKIDSLSFPQYDLLPSASLFWSEYHLPMPVEAGRGCPYGCTFCSLTTLRQRKYRLRSPACMLRMAKKLMADYGTGRIVFLHDNFTVSKRRTLEFCDELEKENLNINWQCSARADSLDDELLKRMADTGCKLIYLGIETGSSRMQEIIHKNLDLDQVLATVNRMVDLGIRFTGSFITGFPEECNADLLETIRFMMELVRVSNNGPDRLQLHGLCPLHGSPLYDKYRDNLLLGTGCSDLVLSDLSDDEMDLVRKHPDIFSAFYNYPTPHLDQRVLARIPYFILNLLRLRYTTLLLLADSGLDFPKCILDDEALLELVPGHSYHDIGTVKSYTEVCNLLARIFVKRGLGNHPIHDVMKYDLARRIVADDENGESSAYIGSFSFDVQSWLKEFEALRFRTVPPRVQDGACDVLLWRENGGLRSTLLSQGLV